jgi:glycosyltransferase involved in cell wall biosynthesis
MKVNLDVSAVPARPAGAGRYVVEMARRLPAAELDLTVVTRRDDIERWGTLAPRASALNLVPSPRPARLLFEAVQLARGVSAQADLWHGPHYTMPHRAQIPVVVTICDMTFFTNPEWHEKSKVPVFRRAISYAARHADALISISDTTTRLLHDIAQPRVPVTTIPLGVDLGRFTPEGDDQEIFEAAHLPFERPYFFFLGTFEPRKGLDVLLDAFSDVAANDTEVELWLGGQAGWHATGSDDLLARHPFASRIRRLGYVDDALVPALMRRARAVCYPSRGEGFGLPALEALACGAQVITSRDTVMEDITGSAAELVGIGDVSGLAHAMTRTAGLSDHDRAERSRVARARAEVFSWDATAEAHRALYQQVISHA